MSYEFNHVHLKAADPGKTADWYVKAFNFSIINDAERPSGDRFIRCATADGVVVNISGARSIDQMGPGDAAVHWGLEHIGITVDDMDAEIERLKGMDAELLEGPTDVPGGPIIAFVQGPDDVRIELLQLRG